MSSALDRALDRWQAADGEAKRLRALNDKLKEALGAYSRIIGTSAEWILGNHPFGGEECCARCEHVTDIRACDEKARAALAAVEGKEVRS